MHPKIQPGYLVGYIKSGLAYICFATEDNFSLLAEEKILEWDNVNILNPNGVAVCFEEGTMQNVKRLQLSNKIVANNNSPYTFSPSNRVIFQVCVGTY